MKNNTPALVVEVITKTEPNILSIVDDWIEVKNLVKHLVEMEEYASNLVPDEVGKRSYLQNNLVREMLNSDDEAEESADTLRGLAGEPGETLSAEERKWAELSLNSCKENLIHRMGRLQKAIVLVRKEVA